MKVYGQEIQIPHAVREIYPFESRWMDVQGYKMHYLDEGERSGMPAVVLLHGNPTWSFLYREIIPLIRPFCRAVAPDYVGMGLSDKPANERFCTLENHTRIITEFIERLGIRNIILVVQDWAAHRVRLCSDAS